MTTNPNDSQIDSGEERATESVRTALLQRAQASGVKPFTWLAEFAGDVEMTTDFDVDEFLRQVREDRSRT